MVEHTTSSAAAQLTLPNVMRTQASEHGRANVQRSRMTQSLSESAVDTDRRTGCMICQSRCCGLLSHRLLNLDILRRVARSEKKKTLSPGKANKKIKPLATEHIRRTTKFAPTVLCVPVTRASGLDHFVSFPVEGVHQGIIQLFHSFFASQGSSLLMTQRNLSFDSGHWAFLYPAACQNSALAMSCVAMSATFHRTQTQNLLSPSHELLGYYTHAFEELRKKIEVELLSHWGVDL